MKRIVAIAVLFLVLPWCAMGAQKTDWDREIKSAQAALAKGEYETAYADYRRVADHNPLAQLFLGLFHQNGWSRPKSAVTACTWFEKAAQKRIPAAEHFWGDCLAEGIGRGADIPGAIALYERAASHGHLISWCAAADFYIQGKGVEKNAQRGLDMCARAAQAGSPPAMLKLAHYYEDGKDIPQDLAAARRWYQEAAEFRVNEAQYRLGVMLAQGEGGQPNLDAALFWLETAASEGYAPAYLPTAILYANAPLQAETKALAPEHLAKVYLWTSAAKARASDEGQLAEIARIEALLAQVMPDSWRPDLDKQVAEHLAKYRN